MTAAVRKAQAAYGEAAAAVHESLSLIETVYALGVLARHLARYRERSAAARQAGSGWLPVTGALPEVRTALQDWARVLRIAGLRRAELAALDLADLDRSSWTLRVDGQGPEGTPRLCRQTRPVLEA